MAQIKVIIGGDVCPTERDQSLFKEGNAAKIFNDLLGEFATADLAVVNLEFPLIEEPSPIRKTGPVLAAPSECVRGLVSSHIKCVGLANNHILDHGARGVENTLRVCSTAGLLTFGAGQTRDEAGRILVVKVGNLRLGLLAIAEQEWSIATENSPGANPLDPIHFVRTIQKSRGSYDFLIVLLHSGIEQYTFPTPRQMETSRFIIEQGARMVICQHSHCAGCYESYQNGHIIYGQGNLIFDSPDQDQSWHEGFLVRLLINDDLTCEWQPIPYVQSEAEAGAKKMPPDREHAFLNTLRERSRGIQEPGRVEAEWDKYCAERHHYFMSSMLGHNRLLRRLNRDSGAIARLYPEDRFMLMTNILRCAIHRETALTVLRRQLGNMNKPAKTTSAARSTGTQDVPARSSHEASTA
jgi:poly-gamma-glutamate capsule biosynthesis protein CapA/YwtB (metallophosphatase superfamily)